VGLGAGDGPAVGLGRGDGLTDGPGDAALTEFVVVGAWFRALWLQDLPAALAGLERHGQACPQLDARLRGERAYLTLTCGRAPEPELLRLADDARAPSLLRLARAATFMAQGRTAEAADELALVEPDGDRVASLVATLEGLAQVLGGDVAAGVEAALRRWRDAIVALDARSLSGHAYVAALGLSLLGRFEEIESIVEVALRLGDANVFQGHHTSGLFALGSAVAEWEGRPDHAHTLALRAQSLGAQAGPYPAMLARRDRPLYPTPAVGQVGEGAPARGSASASSGDPTPVASQMWAGVEDLLGRGLVTAALHLAVEAIDLDPAAAQARAVVDSPVRPGIAPTAAARARAAVDVGAQSQSPVVRAWARYVATVVAGEPDGFGETTGELRRVCGPLDATRACITWALLARRGGDLGAWLEWADAAWRESAGLRRHCDGLLARLAAAVNLTAREAEVARSAALGLSSPEIAQQAGIATRTIEAYLHAVYRKTGVGNREDLARVARTWLALRPRA